MFLHFLFSGWNLRGLQCYQFFNIRHSWQKASELCKRYVYHYSMFTFFRQNISSKIFLVLAKKNHNEIFIFSGKKRCLWPPYLHAKKSLLFISSVQKLKNLEFVSVWKLSLKSCKVNNTCWLLLQSLLLLLLLL